MMRMMRMGASVILEMSSWIERMVLSSLFISSIMPTHFDTTFNAKIMQTPTLRLKKLCVFNFTFDKRDKLGVTNDHTLVKIVLMVFSPPKGLKMQIREMFSRRHGPESPAQLILWTLVFLVQANFFVLNSGAFHVIIATSP